jgi:ABC-type sugar transport system ATPase subunit
LSARRHGQRVPTGLQPAARENFRVTPLELSQVSKQFPTRAGAPAVAVANLNLCVAAGQLLTLVGPSGCGKTTTLRLIAGLESPDTGIIKLAGRVVNDLAPKARDVAMVFQRDALLPHLTAAENLAFGLTLRGVSRPEISQRVTELAARLGLTTRLARKPGELSGGERQRVALGRALIRQPRLLLLDEPFAHLDAPLRRELRRELLRLHREQNLTTLLVTHDQAEALALGDRVAVMNAGRIEQIGPPTELRDRPATPFVRAFLDPSVI